MARRKTLFIILVLVTAAVLPLLMFVLSVLKKGRADPEVVAELAATRQFVEDHKAQLLQFDKRLDSIQAMVTRENWLSTEETVATIQQDDFMLLWAHELKGEEFPEFNEMLSGRSYSDLEAIEPMLELATDSSMAGAYNEFELTKIEKTLQRAMVRYIVVAELRGVVLPEITDLDLGNKTGEAGHFIPGRTTFGVAVVDMEAMEIVASSQGTATNSEEVRVLEGTSQDLWHRTGDAANIVARRIMGQSP
jgi:hypothetical protein